MEILFYIFAALTLVSGALVLLSRNPVTSAMFLVLTIVWLAGLFVLLHAFFLAAVQILVYAGAVMVLFLFVIMLLDLREEERRRIQATGWIAGNAAAVAFLALLLRSILAARSVPGTEPATRFEGATSALGRALFVQDLLPFEVISLLLLVAMIGVVLLSKKDLR